MSELKARIGAHMPSAGGVHRSCVNAASLKLHVLQLFTANNRQWCFQKIDQDEVAKFLLTHQQYKIQKVFSHSAYLINLASKDSGIYERSVLALRAELERCNQLQIRWTVVHPGSAIEGDYEQAYNRIALGISAAVCEAKGLAHVLLENSAGQGSRIPFKIEELGKLFKRVSEETKGVGVCIDTCHAWAAGYDLSTKQKNEDFWELVDKHIGLSHVILIHTNDAKQPHASRIDRHARLGEGTMGLSAFEYLVKAPSLQHIPLVLETPYDDLADYRTSIDVLESYID